MVRPRDLQRPPDVSQPVGNPLARTVFRCPFCSRVSPAGTPAARVALETRPRTYRFRPNANRLVRRDSKGKRKVIHLDDPGGLGREAVREVVACPDCAARLGR